MAHVGQRFDVSFTSEISGSVLPCLYLLGMRYDRNPYSTMHRQINLIEYLNNTYYTIVYEIGQYQKLIVIVTATVKPMKCQTQLHGCTCEVRNRPHHYF